MRITVDVISDIICPWCYIGKRRLEKAIAALEGSQDVQLRWLPFRLNPSIPKEGIGRREYRTQKFGSWERSQELDANVVAVGETEGIYFAFDLIERTPNTIDAHRLIWLSDQQACQDAVVEALFRAYFMEGKDISKSQSILDVVSGAGLDRKSAEAMLNSEQGMDAIKEAKALSQEHGVDGVPFFIINNENTISGAQQASTFVEVFRKVGK